MLVGAGIMSATLGIFLRRLFPNMSVAMYERLTTVAAESSDAWNNAGTGHEALCELNYTPMVNGTVDISKAVKIRKSFARSKQLWAGLVKDEVFTTPSQFISAVPHMSIVYGEANANFLRRRYIALRDSGLFADMQYSEDRNTILEWAPLTMEGRDPRQVVAATFAPHGSDVNFGELTRGMVRYLETSPHFNLELRHQIEKIERNGKGWTIVVKNLNNGELSAVDTDFVFIGAGGGSLPLLKKAGIKEGDGFGGMSIDGLFLRCINPDVVARHHVKMYGQAEVGTPPMSTPHLDTRLINGVRELLFGPYAGFSTKFLKEGSVFDLIKSVSLDNIRPMLTAGMDNFDLTKYLIDQVTLTAEERFKFLQSFMPGARMQDWVLVHAGIRVQIIRKTGVLEFGTEMVSSEDNTIAALLGASPGASTSVSIIYELLQKCFAEQLNAPGCREKLDKMFLPNPNQILGI